MTWRTTGQPAGPFGSAAAQRERVLAGLRELTKEANDSAWALSAAIYEAFPHQEGDDDAAVSARIEAALAPGYAAWLEGLPGDLGERIAGPTSA